MKKFIVAILASSIILSSTVPVMAQTSTEIAQKQHILVQIKQEQDIYNRNVKLASHYLDLLITGNLSFIEGMEYRIKLKSARKKYDDAADKMLELKKELWELENS